MRELNLDSIPKPKACPLMGGEPCKRWDCAAWAEFRDAGNERARTGCAIVTAGRALVDIDLNGLSTY